MKVKVIYPNKMATETTLELTPEELFITWKNGYYEEQMADAKESEEAMEVPLKYFVERITLE